MKIFKWMFRKPTHNVLIGDASTLYVVPCDCPRAVSHTWNQKYKVGRSTSGSADPNEKYCPFGALT